MAGWLDGWMDGLAVRVAGFRTARPSEARLTMMIEGYHLVLMCPVPCHCHYGCHVHGLDGQMFDRSSPPMLASSTVLGQLLISGRGKVGLTDRHLRACDIALGRLRLETLAGEGGYVRLSLWSIKFGGIKRGKYANRLCTSWAHGSASSSGNMETR